MPKIALRLSYLGSEYHGWQRQQNANTIQQELEGAIEQTCELRTVLSGCGRTDSGVHAKIYVASCELDTSIPLSRLPAALNSRLPRHIVIEKAVAVPPEFDARFSCIKKEYTYVIHNGRTRDPFMVDRAYFYPSPLDVSAMRRGASALCGIQDFAALKNEGTPVKSTVREIYYCDITQDGEYISIHVCADGFLYNMVRTIAGTLIYCGCGKLEPACIPALLCAKNREAMGPTAPPCGLYMTSLTYDMEELDGCKR